MTERSHPRHDPACSRHRRPRPAAIAPLLLACTWLPPALAEVDLPRADAVPGGVALVTLGPAGGPTPTVRSGKRRVMVRETGAEQVAVVGIPLSAKPGTRNITVSEANGGTRTVSFQVTAKDYATQHITIKDRRKVNPSAEDMKRITRERDEIRAARDRWSEGTVSPLPLLLPVEGRRSSPFGLRRYFNGQRRRPHSGLDIAAPRGTPVRAAQSGEVIETGDYFFNGKSVFLDHGQGLLTFYFHLDRIDVEPGQRVTAGEVVGTVGSTGRATGPHLHWGVSLNRVMVDPDLFMTRETASTP